MTAFNTRTHSNQIRKEIKNVLILIDDHVNLFAKIEICIDEKKRIDISMWSMTLWSGPTASFNEWFFKIDFEVEGKTDLQLWSFFK